MLDNAPHIPRILLLARQMEEDIRQRRLQPGDAYLNTEQVSSKLGVSTSTANRAMQLLVKRRLVRRQQGRGAVIAEGILADQQPAIRAVHFLIHQEYSQAEGLLADGLLVGMQGELPGADVQMNFLRADGDPRNVERVIAAAARSPDPEGFVLVLAPLAVQRLVDASGLPAVVHGGVQPSVRGMARVDWDHRQSAHLLVQYLLGKGHRRILYLPRDRLFPGDSELQDGILESLTEAGLPPSALIIRGLPADHEAVKAEVRAVFECAGKAGPWPGILANSEFLADGAAAAVESLGLAVGREVNAAVFVVYRGSGQRRVRYAHTATIISAEQLGAKLGRILADLAGGRPIPEHESVPVALREPDAS